MRLAAGKYKMDHYMGKVAQVHVQLQESGRRTTQIGMNRIGITAMMNITRQLPLLSAHCRFNCGGTCSYPRPKRRPTTGPNGAAKTATAPGKRMFRPENLESRLERIWSAEVGPGYSGPTISGNRVYLTDRNQSPEEERILCLDRKTGDVVWEHRYSAPYKLSYPLGPRAAVTIAERQSARSRCDGAFPLPGRRLRQSALGAEPRETTSLLMCRSGDSPPHPSADPGNMAT